MPNSESNKAFMGADAEESVLNIGRKYRLYPTSEQAALMMEYCGATRFVYNLALEQRRASYEIFRKSPGYAGQCADLKTLRADSELAWLRNTPMQVLQQSLMDLRVAYDRFFAATSGYPKFKRKFMNESFRVPQHVVVRRINRCWGEVRLQGLGWIRFRHHRALDGAVKSATVKFSAGEWHVSFLVKRKRAEPNTHVGPAVGVDVGVAHAVTASTGEFRDSEPWTLGMRQRLLRLERKLARQVRGGTKHAKTKLAIARLHARVARRRADANHKTSDYLARNFGLVAMEDLKTKNMTKSAKGTVEAPGTNVAAKRGLNKAILDVGWAQLCTFTEYKCEREGSVLALVPARYSSQECSECGYTEAANRESQAVFRCQSCAHVENADVNAAKVVEARGVEQVGFVVRAGGNSAPACGGFGVRPSSEAGTTGASGDATPRTVFRENFQREAALKEAEDITKTITGW